MQCIKCGCKLKDNKNDNITKKCQWCRAEETKIANKVAYND